MKQYNIYNMIIDNEVEGIEEEVSAYFNHKKKDYCITFNKADLEIINCWVFDNTHSLPATISEDIIESIREDVKNRI
ncbi:hypothetical protein ACERII_17700 [Evansella sp. AB-rgal1]|uniref:hypothetical protein n=1 Tax=Evansella sp. AB-rgal1 TaxID=3242696 RepID=UPI00359D4831